jgi:hypothetical protein
MEIVKEKIRTDKKLFVATNLQLTESEAKAFWPVYDAYQAEHVKLTEQNDITSKRALSLIIVLFRPQAPTPGGAAPILTLPTG